MYEELIAKLRDHNACISIKTLDEAADAIEELQEDNAALNGTVSNLIGQIAELSKPHWIPVTERLPEKNGKYLCNVKRFGLYAGKQYYYVDVLVFQENCFFEDGIGTERVTHWQPLQEPPKGE